MNAEAHFWDWFIRHEAELFAFDSNDESTREKLFNRLAAEIKRVDPDLVFEFGPRERTREFVISAGGIKRAFPAVVSLAKAAPPLQQWTVIAFRPRRPPAGRVEFQGREVDSDSVQFSLLDNGKTAGIHLFIPGYRENDIAFQQIGYLLLDEALGEYDVETRLGLIKMFSHETQTPVDRFPLKDLPQLFDQLVSRLEGGSGKPA